jgi:phosphonate transport system substrate-binding protein
MMELPKSTRPASRHPGGDFTGLRVNVDFYKPIIDARKATIGG